MTSSIKIPDDFSPTDYASSLAAQLFKTYISSEELFHIMAQQKGSILHIVYSKKHQLKYEYYALDLNNPDNIKELRNKALRYTLSG